MPKQITTGQTITLTEARLKSLTYAYEDRGDPPVPTLVEVRSYELVTDTGDVHEVRRVGVEVDPATVAKPVDRWTIVQSAIKTAEGL